MVILLYFLTGIALVLSFLLLLGYVDLVKKHNSLVTLVTHQTSVITSLITLQQSKDMPNGVSKIKNIIH